jgi:formate dehydrogenase subunit gamma
MAGMQLAQVLHSVLSLGLIGVIIGHIYIGSVGMQGAFDAMGKGDVDLNWAKEHHSLWVKEQEAKARSGAD